MPLSGSEKSLLAAFIERDGDTFNIVEYKEFKIHLSQFTLASTPEASAPNGILHIGY